MNNATRDQLLTAFTGTIAIVGLLLAFAIPSVFVFARWIARLLESLS